MEKERAFTSLQVAQHNSKQDCWLIINGMVLDVTEFLEEHPGGEEILMESTGEDVTQKFEDIGHSKAANNLLLKYHIGYLQGYNPIHQDKGHSSSYAPSSSTMQPESEEIYAFVIKEDSKPKFAAFLQFFVPILVAASFFGYRYLTEASQLSS